MILTIFILALIFMGVMLFLGFGYGNFGFAYLGMFTMLVMGLFLFSGGLQIDNGIQESPVGSHIFITVWETHTTVNDPMVNLAANTMFYLPLAGILLTTFIALRR